MTHPRPALWFNGDIEDTFKAALELVGRCSPVVSPANEPLTAAILTHAFVVAAAAEAIAHRSHVALDAMTYRLLDALSHTTISISRTPAA